jgi:hypothetical protein
LGFDVVVYLSQRVNQIHTPRDCVNVQLSEAITTHKQEVVNQRRADSTALSSQVNPGVFDVRRCPILVVDQRPALLPVGAPTGSVLAQSFSGVARRVLQLEAVH